MGTLCLFPEFRTATDTRPWQEARLHEVVRGFATHPHCRTPQVTFFHPTGGFIADRFARRRDARWMALLFSHLVRHFAPASPTASVRRCVQQWDERGYQCGAVQVTIAPTVPNAAGVTMLHCSFHDLLTGHYLTFLCPDPSQASTELLFGIGHRNGTAAAVQYLCLVLGEHPVTATGLYISGYEFVLPGGIVVHPGTDLHPRIVTNLWDRATALIDDSDLYTTAARATATRSKE